MRVEFTLTIRSFGLFSLHTLEDAQYTICNVDIDSFLACRRLRDSKTNIQAKASLSERPKCFTIAIDASGTAESGDILEYLSLLELRRLKDKLSVSRDG